MLAVAMWFITKRYYPNGASIIERIGDLSKEVDEGGLAA